MTLPPRVSVVVKAYNHEPYVARCIQSILDQSFQDFEIVTTDDASTDNTAAVLRGFTDPRISFVQLPRNLGISGAMNATLARARGDYVAILNSDDWALPDRLAEQTAFLDAHPEVGAVFGLPVFVDDRDQLTEGFNDFTLPLRFPDFSRTTWLRQFFFRGNCLCAPAAMVRRSVYRQVGDYDIRLTSVQDLDFWVRAVLAGVNLHVVDRPVTAFRIRDGQRNASAPRRDTALRFDFEFRQILRHFEAIDPDLLVDERSYAAASAAARLARIAFAVDAPAHRSFALQTLHDRAESADDIDLLRELTGSADLHGGAAIADLSHHVAALTGHIDVLSSREHAEARRADVATQRADHEERRADQEAERADQQASHAEEQRHRADMSDRARAAVEAELSRLKASRSWRYTEGFRNILRALRGGRDASPAGAIPLRVREF